MQISCAAEEQLPATAQAMLQMRSNQIYRLLFVRTLEILKSPIFLCLSPFFMSDSVINTHQIDSGPLFQILQRHFWIYPTFSVLPSDFDFFDFRP